MNKFLMKINNILMSSINDNTLRFDYDYFSKLSNELNSNDNPFHRSFLQYKAQFKTAKNLKLINLCLIILSPLLLIIPIFLFIFFRKNKIIDIQGIDILAVVPYYEIIPEHLFYQRNIQCITNNSSKCFSFYDAKFCYKIIVHYFFTPIFWLKCIYAIFQHSMIAKIKVGEVLVSNEYSFTSSILTHYFHQYGKLVSNCMHGEKVLCLRDCFSYYDTFYVWDEYYIQLFNKMNVKADFKIAFCSFLTLNLYADQNCKKHSIIFFLQGIETKNDLIIILNKLKRLSLLYNQNYYVKPHPRYMNKFLFEIFNQENILLGDFNKIIQQASIVASNYSTVLFQVYINREKVQENFPLIVINDLMQLPEGYIMISKSNFKFSEI